MVKFFRATFPKAFEIYFGPFTETGTQTTVGIIHLDDKTGSPATAFYGLRTSGSGSGLKAMGVYRDLSWLCMEGSAVPADVKAKLTEVLAGDLICNRLAPNQALWHKVVAGDGINQVAHDAAHTEMTLNHSTLSQRETQGPNPLKWVLLLVAVLVVAVLAGWYFFGK